MRLESSDKYGRTMCGNSRGLALTPLKIIGIFSGIKVPPGAIVVVVVVVVVGVDIVIYSKHSTIRNIVPPSVFHFLLNFGHPVYNNNTTTYLLTLFGSPRNLTSLRFTVIIFHNLATHNRMSFIKFAQLRMFSLGYQFDGGRTLLHPHAFAEFSKIGHTSICVRDGNCIKTAILVIYANFT